MVEEIVKSKEQSYRGIPIEELKKMDVRESAKYLSSRSRRSVLRHFDLVEKFIKKCESSLVRKKRIRTHLRDMVIMPKLVGLTISIYNGKNFHDIQIIPEMIGHRLGEFAATRSRVSHGAAGIGATKSTKTQKK